LKQANKEKEEALEKAKNDLKEKQRKMEEDNHAQQEGPSDPESTTSSLTVSSGSEGRKTGEAKKTSPESADDSNESSDNKRKANDDNEGTKKPEKKSRLRTHESSECSSSDDGGGKPAAQQRVNIDQFVSVSDITDSNKDSSSDGNSSSACQQQRPSTTHKTSRSGSPNVAAARDATADRDDHSDVVIAGRKRKAAQTRTKEKKNKAMKFQLDYEEVFLKSNVPQILATTSGRIVAWNDFFLKATSLKKEEIDRLTIFSLVQASKLSNLFEIVAAALRYGTLDSSASEGEEGKESSADGTTKPSSSSGSDANGASLTRNGNYTAITLPCTHFGTRPKPVAGGEVNANNHFTVKPLYMTVTLMTDNDPRKRCFHCILTDCPGTNGSLGRVTPELLSLMFQ